MIIKQLSVFLQNELGRLEEATKVLSDNNINISALSIAETEGYGILRMIVNDTDKAAEALKGNEFSVKVTDVLRIDAPDVPGAVHSIINKLSNAGIDIAYIYGYSSNGIAPLIIKVSDPERADQVIKGC
ncbi:MAG: acetolactate synthase [Firmicutes bacterium]|nr:acetolactate synthase [Bacillota bacterium]